MKHGIYYAFWEQEWEADYIKYIQKVADLGFDILEIGAKPLVAYSKEQIQNMRHAAESSNIMLTAGYGPAPHHNIAIPEGNLREQAFEWYARLFDVMAQLNIHSIGGGLYSYWPVDYAAGINKTEDLKYSIEGVRRMAEMAAPYGIMLWMESLNRFEGYLINTAEEGVAFCEAVGCDNVQLMLDTFHMNIEETSIGGAIRHAGKYLGHLHTGECNRMLPGKGRMPWREIGEALADIHYRGNVVMEPFIQMGGSVGRDIKVWRDISKGICESALDAEVKKALEFQRYMLGGA
ncbi:MAG: sugar phosphate isomerase/epimerase [Lachnospiraceae bacterium]|nr:sugar phosphate isomerase/epimerase [Lachnospiraceae bacterium]